MLAEIIGIRPLFIAYLDKGWAFASEMKSLIDFNPSKIGTISGGLILISLKINFINLFI